MWLQLALALIAIYGTLSGVAFAQVIDPHAVYEDRCARCHAEHSGEFSRNSMIKQHGGQIVGRKTGAVITEFLVLHRGTPSQLEVAALVEMFALQLKTSGLYKDKCGMCHTSAKRLARVRLEVRDDRLVDRVTRRDITAFLNEHGRLNADEVSLIDEMLRWQLKTVGR